MAQFNNPQLRLLSVFSIIMITVTSVDSIRNLPATALFGTPLIFFFIVGAIFFLIPAALVSAELAAAWPKRGGVYLWVKEAFGVKWGFLAIWFQWVENVVWYPTILSFFAGTIAYLINPHLADNKYYLIGVILVTYWVTTLINIRGLNTSAWVSVFCGIVGLLLPMGLIILLGTIWILDGQTLQISFAPHHWLPNFSDPTLLVSMTGVLLSYSGIEIATVHARETRNPQRDFPRAMWISSLIIALTLILGSLAIAVVVPNAKLNLVSGIMQAFSEFLSAYHLAWFIPCIAILIALGTIGAISNWTLAPIRGLLAAAQDGNLPPILQHENRFAAPTSLLWLQAIIVTFIAGIFVLMPSINSSYWLLTAASAQLYMVMYIIMFAAAIKLRYKHPTVKRPFIIPGGKAGIWFIAGLGFLTSIFTLIIGFFPPQGVNIGSLLRYESFIIGLFLLMSIPPFIIYALRKPHWKDVAVAKELLGTHL